MAGFVGGSAWKMAQDIGGGYCSLNSVTVKKFELSDIRILVGEIEKRQRDLRGEQSAKDDLETIKGRNRELTRLSQALSLLRAYAFRRFKVQL